MHAWGDSEPYFWVVVCKNRKYHDRQNIYSGHKIALCETDGFSSPPNVESFAVRCDECGAEQTYTFQDLMRFQMPLNPEFRTHPLFV
jgi:hypothetical protein